MIKFFKSRPFFCFFILLISGIDVTLYYIYGYPTKIAAFGVVFFSVTIAYIATLISFIYTEKDRDKSDKLENFLEIPRGELKYNHIMTFFSDQVFGTFLTTLMLVYGRKLFEITGNVILSAVFSGILFVVTMTIITLSLGKISLQIFYSKISDINQWILVIIFVAIACWFFTAGIELAPKISPNIQQKFFSK
ncbi:TPA: hypothetical protein U2P84_001319 [Acinetobacter baumannii]|nr:hypothetical protein [Acinetobacter baumannii]